MSKNKIIAIIVATLVAIAAIAGIVAGTVINQKNTRPLLSVQSVRTNRADSKEVLYDATFHYTFNGKSGKLKGKNALEVNQLGNGMKMDFSDVYAFLDEKALSDDLVLATFSPFTMYPDIYVAMNRSDVILGNAVKSMTSPETNDREWKFTYCKGGSAIDRIDTNTLVARYVYNKDGTVKAIQDGEGASIEDSSTYLATKYNKEGQLTDYICATSDKNFGRIHVRYENGRVSELTCDQNEFFKRTYEYDAQGRIKLIRDQNSGDFVNTLAFTYDQDGKLVSLKKTVDINAKTEGAYAGQNALNTSNNVVTIRYGV